MIHRLPTLLPIAMLALAMAGCILPTQGHSEYRSDMGHRPITKDVLAALTPGVTTADGVRANLGRPTWKLAGGRILAYSWYDGRATSYRWALTVPIGWHYAAEVGDGSPIGRPVQEGGTYHLLLEFDSGGALRQHRVVLGDIDPAAVDLDRAVRPPPGR